MVTLEKEGIGNSDLILGLSRLAVLALAPVYAVITVASAKTANLLNPNSWL